MPKYDFFISYSHKDAKLHRDVTTALKSRGYSVFDDTEIPPGLNWAEVIADAISNSTYFIPLITDAFLSSTMAKHELQYAVSVAQERGQTVFPLYFTEQPLSPGLTLMLSAYHSFFVHQSHDLKIAIDSIDQAASYQVKLARLYEKLAEYSNLGHEVKTAEALCQLLELHCLRWKDESTAARRKLGIELCRLLQRLAHYCGEDDRKLANRMLSAINAVSALLPPFDATESIFHRDLFFASFAIHLLHWDREVRLLCADMATGGDVSSHIINPYPVDRFIERQKPYVQTFKTMFERVKDTLDNDPRFTAEEIDFIKQTPEFIRVRAVVNSPSYRVQEEKPAAVSEDEEILISIAKFMQDGNKLFDLLQKRGIAGDFLKCLLTSYERLKNYCQVVGAKDVAADCIDRIVELRDQIVRQPSESAGNEKAENGIKSLLGFTLHNSGNYDVFISFKNEDSDMAEKIYQLCQRHMKVPFWSKRSLPELSKSEYEDAIYNALRKAKHFVVVLSNLEYLNANWIQREMKAFDRAITEGRKPGGNFVIVATDNVYEQILNCNKMCLDERYCGYQIIKMSAYANELIHYLT